MSEFYLEHIKGLGDVVDTYVKEKGISFPQAYSLMYILTRSSEEIMLMQHPDSLKEIEEASEQFIEVMKKL